MGKGFDHKGKGNSVRATPSFRENVVFASGKDGYHTYRIPAVLVSQAGTVLAICEGRRNSRSDHGDIDLLLKRSTDGGQTWSAQQMIYGEPGEITIGNPCPVVDKDTGAIWMAFTRDNDDVLVTHSEDDGTSWAKPVVITAAVKPPDWVWYATGPVNGIQIRSGPHRGRLVLPCDHRVKARDEWNTGGHSHAIYSDDHGRTWRLGKATGRSMNECTVAELSGGSLMLNMRSYRGRHLRAVAVSEDGGETWSTPVDDPVLVEPVCQASLLRYTAEAEGGGNRMLFSNPASERREKMTVRLSYDEGKTWPVAKLLHAGPSAYSCLTALPDGCAGCLYEGGEADSYETIRFARFNLEWLTDGADCLTPLSSPDTDGRS